MQKMSVSDARQASAVGKAIKLEGWVRTRRDSKGGFSSKYWLMGSWPTTKL
jgi:asparaginyl-tRNA synthetase